MRWRFNLTRGFATWTGNIEFSISVHFCPLEIGGECFLVVIDP